VRRTILPALAGALALTVTLTPVAPAAAASPSAETAADKAVTWLAGQQQNDGGFEMAGFPGFETPDGVLAVAEAAQTGDRWDTKTARTAVTAMVKNGHNPLDALDDLVDTPGFSGGQAAKLIALDAVPLGLDPRDFDPQSDTAGQVDLVAKMDAAHLPDGSYGAGVINTTFFAVLANAALGRPIPWDTVGYIESAQQANGSWHYSGSPSGTGVDVDTTSYAVMALVAAGRTRSDASVHKALQLLASAQFAAGGWGDDYGSGPEVNTNSTALSAMALRAAGLDAGSRAWRDTYAPARSGEGYVAPETTLLSRQVADGHFTSPFDGWGLNSSATSQAVEGLLLRWLPIGAASGTASRFVGVVPTRLLDTRNGTGAPVARLGSAASLTFDVAGASGSQVPAEATAVVLNLTAVAPSESTFLTAYPAAQMVPWTSNLNPSKGAVLPNMVTVRTGIDGGVSVFNAAGTVDVVADVVGYYTASDAAAVGFEPLTPRRLLDTRDGTGTSGTSPIGAGGERALHVADGNGAATGVPSDATSVVLNVTVASATTGTFITVYPAGVTRPGTSSLNAGPGPAVANLVTVKVGSSGNVRLYNAAGRTHLVADVAGYYREGGHDFVPTTPRRLYDSREHVAVNSASDLQLTATSEPSIPPSATALALNTTATQPTAGSYLVVYPDGVTRPATSNLNFGPGATVANHVIVGLSGADKFLTHNAAGSVHVIQDVNGYFT